MGGKFREWVVLEHGYKDLCRDGITPLSVSYRSHRVLPINNTAALAHHHNVVKSTMGELDPPRQGATPSPRVFRSSPPVCRRGACPYGQERIKRQDDAGRLRTDPSPQRLCVGFNAVSTSNTSCCSSHWSLPSPARLSTSAKHGPRWHRYPFPLQHPSGAVADNIPILLFSQTAYRPSITLDAQVS